MIDQYYVNLKIQSERFDRIRIWIENSDKTNYLVKTKYGFRMNNLDTDMEPAYLDDRNRFFFRFGSTIGSANLYLIGI